jgi:GNAT superfamily N-acetyltransferase
MAAETLEQAEARVRRQVRLCLEDDRGSCYVAEDASGAVVGYASVHWLPNFCLPNPEGYLSELFVDEAHRGTGTGRALLEAVVSEAKARGCSRLMLITNRVRESYRRKFYLKAGWIERDSMANFIYEL